MKIEKEASAKSAYRQVLDYERFLKDMCYNKEDLATKLITMLINERGPQLLRELREAIDAKDDEKIGSVCHTLKGTTANMCADRLSETAAELSQLVREGDASIHSDMFDELHRQFEEIIEWWEQKTNSEDR